MGQLSHLVRIPKFIILGWCIGHISRCMGVATSLRSRPDTWNGEKYVTRFQAGRLVTDVEKYCWFVHQPFFHVSCN